MAKKIITICSSSNFYKHVNEVADELVARGYEIIVPKGAIKMRKSGNYNVEDHRTWFKNPEDYAIKRELMDAHFAEVVKADAILLVNDEKHGVTGYIGPNGLMEMALAYYFKKPIFVLNLVSEEAGVYEEVTGMGCIILNGNLEKLRV